MPTSSRAAVIRKVVKVRLRDGRTFPLDTDLLIGRSPYCSIVLDHESVSRVHAVVRRVDGAIEIEDKGSTNGTSVRGARIARPTLVAPGDDIRIGDERLEVTEIEVRESGSTGARNWIEPAEGGPMTRKTTPPD